VSRVARFHCGIGNLSVITINIKMLRGINLCFNANR